MKNTKHSSSEVKPDDNLTITLWIDSYSDMFSDFDPRPYGERTLSDDFISQVKRLSRETTERISVLKLLVPEGTQKEEIERVIKKRLQIYFSNFSNQLQDEWRKMKRKGIWLTLGGIALIIAASYISFLRLTSYSFNLVLALFEPGGWFLLWNGLDIFFSHSWRTRRDVQFYNRMQNVHVEFSSYK